MPIRRRHKNSDPSTRRFTDDTEGNWLCITTKDPQISFCLVYKQDKDKLVTSYYGKCLNTHDSDCAWGGRNWLPTWPGREVSCSYTGKDDRNRNQDDSESIKNMQLVILWFPLSSSTTGPSMAWTTPNGSHSFSLFFEKKVFLRCAVLSLTTCSFHKFHTTSHSPGVPHHHPMCKLEMQKSWKHKALSWQMHSA